MRMKQIVVLLMSLAFCIDCQARSLEDIQESGHIVVAVYSNYAPYSFQADGQPQGIDVEIAQAIANDLNVELQLLWLTPDETVEDDLRNAIWKGHIIHRTKADLMMRVPYDKAFSLLRDDVGLLVNELVHMFGPYQTESWAVMHSLERLPELTTMNYFSYHPVGAEIDSVPHFYLISAFGGRFKQNTTHYKSIEEAVDTLVKGDIDAVMGLRTQMHYHSHRLDSEQYPIASMGFPQMAKQQWDIGMAVHTDFRALSYAAGDVIMAMVSDGRLEAIFAQYHVPLQVPKYYSE
ncbi:MAG: transporter substrate-binding domain-containing protein [Alteromonadaceae bacterium]|nr:transporter substrate-binding domain-containing protein [Alteromonadaceae bacterium]